MARSDLPQLKVVIPPDPWAAAIVDGRVGIPGYTLACDTTTANAMIRFDITEGADVGENGVRRLCVQHLKGAAPCAIPVWFGREHMQRNLLVRRDSSIRGPADLAGKRVGSSLTAWSATGAGVMLMLEQAYGVPLEEIEWWTNRPEELPVNRMALTYRPGADSREEHISLLKTGRLDAVIVTSGPRYRSLFGGGDNIDHLLTEHPDLRPLIDDPQTIVDAYHRTGLYMISDLVIVRPAALAQDPDLPVKLLNLFSEANALASAYRSPEEEALARRELELLGDNPHTYGLGEKTRHNLSAFIDFLYRLGAFERPIEPEELLVPSMR